MLRELAQSDRRVSELSAAAGGPQNLVSYHLGLLRRSRLVSERRSSADARDVYYRLEMGRLRTALGELGAGLHPSLAARPRGAPRGAVLFLCSANSARSQIAEALLRQRTGGAVGAASAGTHPSAVHPLTLRALERRGVSTAGLRAKHWSEVGDMQFDRVISLCDIAREELPAGLLGHDHAHWSLPDPAAVRGSETRRGAAFEAAADEIGLRLDGLLAAMAEATAA